MTPAQAAYEALRLHVGAQPWDRLTPATRALWGAVAEAAVRAHLVEMYRRRAVQIRMAEEGLTSPTEMAK